MADALRLITVSKNGLSQSEILDLLTQLGYRGDSQVNSFDWALFRSAALDGLFERPGGLLSFFHQHFKEAAEYTLLGEYFLVLPPMCKPHHDKYLHHHPRNGMLMMPKTMLMTLLPTVFYMLLYNSYLFLLYDIIHAVYMLLYNSYLDVRPFCIVQVLLSLRAQAVRSRSCHGATTFIKTSPLWTVQPFTDTWQTSSKERKPSVNAE